MNELITDVKSLEIETLKNFLDDREILIAREISKIYEEFIRCKIEELKPFEKELKGELTIVISENKMLCSSCAEKFYEALGNIIKIKQLKSIILIVILLM